EFLAWPLSDFALQRAENRSETPQALGHAATQTQSARCTRAAEPGAQHWTKTVARQHICPWIKEIPDRGALPRIRETSDKKTSAHCLSNRFRSIGRAFADWGKQPLCSVRRNGRSAFGA